MRLRCDSGLPKKERACREDLRPMLQKLTFVTVAVAAFVCVAGAPTGTAKPVTAMKPAENEAVGNATNSTELLSAATYPADCHELLPGGTLARGIHAARYRTCCACKAHSQAPGASEALQEVIMGLHDKCKYCSDSNAIAVRVCDCASI